jgi:hypothetical protein
MYLYYFIDSDIQLANERQDHEKLFRIPVIFATVPSAKET